MKTTYVSGPNSFVAYSQDGALNGVEYAKQKFLLQEFNNWYVEFAPDIDLLLTHIFVTGYDVGSEGNNRLTLTVEEKFNGDTIPTIVWSVPCNQPNWSISANELYSGLNINYPVFNGQKLRFSNSANKSLSIRKLLVVFELAIFSKLQ